LEKGYALDIHTTNSVYLGDDDYGHPHFKNEYSQLGELVLKLKYRNDKTVIKDIVEVVVDFLKNEWKIVHSIDYIVPVPPSHLNREYQPVYEIIKDLGSIIHVPLSLNTLVKTKVTQELKDVVNYEKRKEVLQDAFSIEGFNLKEKNILLFDDLYRSGATLQTITEVLYNKGKVKNVFVLTLTKTRSKR
jgi:competence protein ComFC